MLSRRLKFLSFCAAFQHHYTAKLPRMVFPYITPQILRVARCLVIEHLILTFTIVKKTPNSHLCIHFVYINNNTLLFQSLQIPTPRVFLSNGQLRALCQQKMSLVFPIFFFWLPLHGLVSDRQLVHAWLAKQITGNVGGELVLQLQP
jgi:hypothetical protein